MRVLSLSEVQRAAKSFMIAAALRGCEEVIRRRTRHNASSAKYFIGVHSARLTLSFAPPSTLHTMGKCS